MIYPENQKVSALIDLLEQTDLFTSRELNVMEEYLLGDTGGKLPEQLHYRDMSQIGKETAKKMAALWNDCTAKEVVRWGDLLFAVGGTSVYALFPIYMFRYSYCDEALALEPAKKAAAYGACIAGDGYMLAAEDIQRMMELAGNRPAVIREALGYETDTPGGELVLLAVYFLLKYPEAERDAGAETEPVDGICMKRYEDLLLNGLHKMYRGSQAQSDMEEIEKAVREDRVDSRTLGLAQGKANAVIDRPMLYVLGGAAYMNFSLSPCLKNVVKVCSAACTEEMLEVMSRTDLRGDFRERGGRFDRIFNIDSMKLIRWAVGKKRKDILEEQFVHNREAYLAYMDTMDVTDIFMLSVIREKDAVFYQERQNREIVLRRMKVTEALVQLLDVQCRDIVRKYLLEEAEPEALYAWEGRFEYQGNRQGEDHWIRMRQYMLEFGYDSFYARCEALLMVCRGFNWYQYLLEDNDEIKKKRVKRLFAAVDGEKLPLRYQINGYADMTDELCVERWVRSYTAASREVFRVYLRERREEMISAFQGAPVSGKCLGLVLLGEEAEQNKEVILGFRLDASKAVRNSLLDILYKKRNWEKEILDFLGSKKGNERELAVRVLAEWDCEKYRSVLCAALEKEKSRKVKTLLETVLQIPESADRGK